MGFNSTIINKKKKLKCGCFDYNFSKGRCKAHATIQDSQKRIDAYEEAVLDESFANLRDDLDAVFSRYIRLKYSDEKGFVRCYTSGVKLRWQDAQCGHFVPRGNLATRWMEQNCRPQSKNDNEYLGGNLKEFRWKLEQEEKGLPEWLEQQGREAVRPTRDELKQLTINYRHKVKILEAKLKPTDMKENKRRLEMNDGGDSGTNPPTAPPPMPPKPSEA
jgi:hypothetical protein